MQPKTFRSTADKRRTAIFSKDTGARLLVDGGTKDGLQVLIYRGFLPGENAKSSIGHFAIFSTANTEPDTPFQEQLIAAGSLAVRHPSYNHMGTGRRGHTVVTTEVGLIGIPSETGDLPTLNGEVLKPISAEELELAVPEPAADLPTGTTPGQPTALQ